MKQWICTSCEKEEIVQNTCILKCRLTPVGCPAISQEGEPLTPEPRPVELHAACLDCEHWQEKPPKPEKKSASKKSKKESETE